MAFTRHGSEQDHPRALSASCPGSARALRSYLVRGLSPFCLGPFTGLCGHLAGPELRRTEPWASLPAVPVALLCPWRRQSEQTHFSVSSVGQGSLPPPFPSVSGVCGHPVQNEFIFMVMKQVGDVWKTQGSLELTVNCSRGPHPRGPRETAAVGSTALVSTGTSCPSRVTDETGLQTMGTGPVPFASTEPAPARVMATRCRSAWVSSWPVLGAWSRCPCFA